MIFLKKKQKFREQIRSFFCQGYKLNVDPCSFPIASFRMKYWRHNKNFALILQPGKFWISSRMNNSNFRGQWRCSWVEIILLHRRNLVRNHNFCSMFLLSIDEETWFLACLRNWGKMSDEHNLCNPYAFELNYTFSIKCGSVAELADKWNRGDSK